MVPGFWAHTAAGGGASLPQTNLWAWFKTPIGGATNGGDVTTWSDSSGNGRDADGTGHAPKYSTAVQVNGFDSVQYVTNGYFVLPSMAALTAGSIYTVVKATYDGTFNSTVGALWKIGTDATDNVTIYTYTDHHIYDDTFATAYKDAGSNTGVITNWHLYEVVSAASSWTNWQNGTQVFTTGTNTFAGNSSPKIGANNHATNYFDGYMAELIIYSTNHDATTRQQVESYISSRYAIF